jgi:hypothetical protein
MDITSTPADEHRWRAHAACRHDDPSYHEPQQPHPHCDTCPAAEPCLWFALAAEATVGYRYGYWGGTTPARRARIAADLPPGDLTRWYRHLAATWTPPGPRVEHAP